MVNSLGVYIPLSVEYLYTGTPSPMDSLSNLILETMIASAVNDTWWYTLIFIEDESQKIVTTLYTWEVILDPISPNNLPGSLNSYRKENMSFTCSKWFLFNDPSTSLSLILLVPYFGFLSWFPYWKDPQLGIFILLLPIFYPSLTSKPYLPIHCTVEKPVLPSLKRHFRRSLSKWVMFWFFSLVLLF